MSKQIVVLLFSFTLLVLSCNTTEPPPPPPNGVTIENTIALTTLWQDLNKIAINFTRSQFDTTGTYTYRLKRKNPAGSETEYLFILLGLDTTFVDENLTQGTEYIYKVEAEQQGKTTDTSKTIIAATLDTTSHEINWQIDTLGQPGNFLYDVWGLDENNVWAVGYVELRGSGSGIIKWDGSKWGLFPPSEGVKQGIYGFSEESIFVVGESVNRGFAAIWNGNSWTEYRDDYFLSRGDTVYPLTGIWGSAPDDVWAVGNQGTIIHWNGTEWQKVDAGITTRITAIWGTTQSEIYIVPISGVRSALYKFNGSVWQKISDNIGIFSTTLWKVKQQSLLIGGTSLLEYNGSMFQEIQIPGRTRGIVKIRGSNINNIFTAGDFGEITHFNGLSWQDIDDFEVPDGRYRVLYSVWNSENKVFVVGVDENRAIVISGTIN